MPTFDEAFSSAERDALAGYDAVSNDVAARLPDPIGLSEFQASAEWRELASAAERALAAFDASEDDAV